MQLNNDRHALCRKCFRYALVLSSHRALSHSSHYIAQTFSKLYHLAALIEGKKHRHLASEMAVKILVIS